MRPKILIVDDDADIRLGLRVRLAANDFDTVMAGDGISAISAYQRERPNLVLLDLGLPGGDGFIVMHRLRTMGSTAPIIVLSARDPMLSEERALGAGACAFLQKPVDNDQLVQLIREHCPEVTARTVSTRPSAKLLIVDDDPDIRFGLNIRLKSRGFATVLATDAISAMIQYQRERPDLILLDLGLPGGDGFVVMERISELGLGTPVVVISARDPELNRQRALYSGACAFLQKPVGNEELLAAIDRALGWVEDERKLLRVA